MTTSVYKIVFETEEQWNTWTKDMKGEKFPVYDRPKRFPCFTIVILLIGDERLDITVRDLQTRCLFFYQKDSTWDLEEGVVYRDTQKHIDWIRGKV